MYLLLVPSKEAMFCNCIVCSTEEETIKQSMYLVLEIYDSCMY